MPPRKMRPVKPESDFGERARQRQRKLPTLHDFHGIKDGTRERPKPTYFRRSDGQYMFYHGKENGIVAETEAGKDMLLCEMTHQNLEDEISTCWIDFEEDNEIDTGYRLRELGVELYDDPSLLMYITPADIEAASDAVFGAIKWRASVVIFNGLQSAYGLFGWDPYDPASVSMFRRTLVAPLLKHGRAVIETDHVTKTAAEKKRGNGTRYAAGGVAKLNWTNGASYLLEAVEPIIRGGTGASRVVLTKDRPGGVKPACSRMDDDPKIMNAGMLRVKSTVNLSSKDDNDSYSLNIEISAPVSSDKGRQSIPSKSTNPSKSAVDEVVEALAAELLHRNVEELSYRELVKVVPGSNKSRPDKIREAVDAGAVITESEGAGKRTWYFLPETDGEK